jgi:hypothetical protein
LGRLEELDLANNHALGDRAARTLATVQSTTLRQLDVRGTNLTALGVRSLLQAKGLVALTRLDVNAGLLFTRGMTLEALDQEWLQTPLARQLTSLSFFAIPLDRPVLEKLLTWPGIARLTRLALSSCRLDGEAAALLAGCENLGSLRSLELDFAVWSWRTIDCAIPEHEHWLARRTWQT